MAAMKNYRNKGGQETGAQSEGRKLPSVLKCIATEPQTVPGFGQFKNGDKVSDPKAVEYLAGGDYPNPNFVEVNEED